MHITQFIKGIVAGAIIAIPVGPIGILCLRRMIAQGPLTGIASGLGAATADLIYSTIAMAGMTAVSTFLTDHFTFIRVVSSIFLCCIGFMIARTPAHAPRTAKPTDLLEAYISTFLLTLANPLIIFSFIAMFAIVGINYQHPTPLTALLVTSGVFIGSTIWWIILGGLTALLKPKISPTTLSTVNKISGSCIIAFGLITLLSILFK